MKRCILILLFTCAGIPMLAQVNIIKTIAGCSNIPGYGGDGGAATNAKLNYPCALCLDKVGNLLIADPGNNRIRKIFLSSGIITTIAGRDSSGFWGDGGQATDAILRVPVAVAVDSSGDIFIGDGFNRRIRKISNSTGIISTIVGNGSIGNNGDGGPATAAEINGVSNLFFDKSGNLYFTDILNYNIRKVTTDGIISTIAGTGMPGNTGDGGQATNATFSEPNYLIIDNFGNIIIADGGANVIRSINSIGIITTIAGNGTAGYYGDGGPAIYALLNYPYGAYIDKLNNIFFAEFGNGVIRKIDGATGIISTVVGCGVQGFSGDGGPATAAKLAPDGLAMDDNGVMYIADYGNNRIRMVYNDKLATEVVMKEEGYTVYPNPATNEITIKNAEGGEMKLFNLLGQEVLSRKISRDKEVVNIQSLISGTYIIRMQGKDNAIQNSYLIKE